MLICSCGEYQRGVGEEEKKKVRPVGTTRPLMRAPPPAPLGPPVGLTNPNHWSIDQLAAWLNQAAIDSFIISKLTNEVETTYGL